MIFQYFSRHIYFSRSFQEIPLNSSTFQACANPVIIYDFSSTDSVMHIRDELIPLHYSSFGFGCLTIFSVKFVDFLLIFFFFGMIVLFKEYESSFFK